jgi:putative transposase
MDVLLQGHHDTAAAQRFCQRLLAATDRAAPERITTGKLGSYAAAKPRLPEMRAAEREQVRAARRCDNRVEQAHQPTPVRERVMRRFKSVASAQRVLDVFTHMGDLFCRRRHRLTAAAYRTTMRERAATWREVAERRPA